MKRIKYLIGFYGILFSQLAPAQNYVPVDQASSVQFLISNLGFDVNGMFKGLQGKIFFDEKNLSSSFFNVSINANSVETENDARDKHLKGEDYFNVNKYPFIKLVSAKVAKSVTPGYYVLFATLTIKDRMKEVVIPFTVTQEAAGYRFKGEFKIKRRDFDIGGKNTISNELKVKLDVFTKKI